MPLIAGQPSTAIPSTANRTTTPLDNGQTYTGTWELNSLPHVMVSCITDTSGTLYFDFSNDASRVLTFPSGGFKVSAGIHKFQTAVKGGRYFRARFVNDSGSNQTYLELYTYFGSEFVPVNSPLNQTAGIDQAAIFVRSSVPQDEIRIGRRGGVNGWTKFGAKDGLTAAGGDEVIWPSGAFTPLTTASTFTIAYTQANDGSAANGAKTIYVQYIDTNGLPASAVHTLGSDGSDETSFSGLGINRAAVSSSGSTQTNGSDITITATTGGSVQAVIPAGESVTEQCIFFVGSNHDAIVKYLWWNLLKTTGGSSPKVTIKGWAFNRAVATKYLVFSADIDTSVENTNFIDEPVGFNLSPTDVLYFTANTDANSTNVKLRFSLNEYQRT